MMAPGDSVDMAGLLAIELASPVFVQLEALRPWQINRCHAATATQQKLCRILLLGRRMCVSEGRNQTPEPQFILSASDWFTATRRAIDLSPALLFCIALRGLALLHVLYLRPSYTSKPFRTQTRLNANVCRCLWYEGGEHKYRATLPPLLQRRRGGIYALCPRGAVPRAPRSFQIQIVK